MTRDEARVMATKLKDQGKKHDQIGAALAREGFISRRTGKKLSGAGVGFLIREDKAKAKPTPDKKHTKEHLIMTIIASNLPPETQAALIAGML